MARKNPLGMIKDVAVESLKLPASAAGSAFGLVKGAASVGRTAGVQVTRTATGVATDAVTSLVGSRDASTALPDDTRDVDVPDAGPTGRPEPVNVTEELGLDPAPVEKPKPARKAAAKKPVTQVDAKADPSAVDATPADVGRAVARKAPATRKRAAKKPTTRTAVAKASTPGDTLPPPAAVDTDQG